ncbi:prenyltransferase/squalene oxidase repeat-containing protein [Methanolobus bombayensis]|uniref:prenyltransferase/squalene oxidase repeat-containing protein n=1 Tax=Methanolobus bombayensis TaxID=38023 RepID=UPI001AE60260|nr:prenyltransferase/squalene oxidase repeat-containing protein [Methanolobus bombayensis]MBP1908110.1 squalene cyclase [Methanolobus bombayensis]
MIFKSEASFNWLYSQKITKVKDLARVVQASYLWKEENGYMEKLLNLRKGDSWDDDLRDTSRVTSVLAQAGTVLNETGEWILSKQKNGSWNEDVYDSTYALAALADIGSFNPGGCKWLVENYGEKWEHPGTTALIIKALIKQQKIEKVDIYNEFVEEKARWIISKKQKNGSWKTPATTNIVIQSLMIAGYKSEVKEPVRWLLENLNDNGSWGKENGDINTTSLSLITLHEYMSSMIT